MMRVEVCRVVNHLAPSSVCSVWTCRALDSGLGNSEHVTLYLALGGVWLPQGRMTRKVNP